MKEWQFLGTVKVKTNPFVTLLNSILYSANLPEVKDTEDLSSLPLVDSTFITEVLLVQPPALILIVKSPVKEITPTAELPTAPTPTYNRS